MADDHKKPKPTNRKWVSNQQREQAYGHNRKFATPAKAPQRRGR
jgi:hypothetical protein